jgi:hypothetical protein
MSGNADHGCRRRFRRQRHRRVNAERILFRLRAAARKAAQLRRPRRPRRSSGQRSRSNARKTAAAAIADDMRAICSKIEQLKLYMSFRTISPGFSRLFIGLYFKLKHST